ncbi:hypothetical protein [Halovivax gelatinilyticus]|uniref:hypothetical protein n=1 Tax=Halovivax gelatinilyticus TaxID=2961597 RepID=UPI0020CA3F7A|nr:hypothetical protein [Halovivax gelatinilyticus]
MSSLVRSYSENLALVVSVVLVASYVTTELSRWRIPFPVALLAYAILTGAAALTYRDARRTA